MKDSMTEIIAGTGLGELKFGMNPNEVQDLLGKPDEIDTHIDNEDDTGTTETWHYDEMEMSISFEEIDGPMLFSIAVSGEQYEFKGKNLFGLQKEQLINELESLSIDDLKIEDLKDDDFEGQELIFSQKHSINFWLEDGELSEIQFGPFFEDEETLVWPE